MANGESGAFFPTDGNLVLLDKFAYVFETHRGLVQRHAVMFGHSINQVGGGNRLGHAILPASAFNQVVKQQGDDVVGGEESAVGVYDSEAVGVSVSGNTDVRLCSSHFFATAGE